MHLDIKSKQQHWFYSHGDLVTCVIIQTRCIVAASIHEFSIAADTRNKAFDATCATHALKADTKGFDGSVNDIDNMSILW